MPNLKKERKEKRKNSLSMVSFDRQGSSLSASLGNKEFTLSSSVRPAEKKASPLSATLQSSSFTQKTESANEVEEQRQKSYFFYPTQKMETAEKRRRIIWPDGIRFLRHGKSRECLVQDDDVDSFEEILDEYGCEWQKQ